MAPLVRTGGSRHTGLAAPPHRNIHSAKCKWITVTYENVMTDGKQAFLDAKLFLRKLKRYRTVRTVLREDGG